MDDALVKYLADLGDAIEQDVHRALRNSLTIEVVPNDEESKVLLLRWMAEESVPVDEQTKEGVIAVLTSALGRAEGVENDWPRCPSHETDAHTLCLRLVGTETWWLCPLTEERVALCGELFEEEFEYTPDAEDERRKAMHRQNILQALLQGYERRAEILNICASAPTRQDVVSSIASAFGIEEYFAEHIADIGVGSWNAEYKAALIRELDKIASLLDRPISRS